MTNQEKIVKIREKEYGASMTDDVRVEFARTAIPFLLGQIKERDRLELSNEEIEVISMRSFRADTVSVGVVFSLLDTIYKLKAQSKKEQQ